MEPENLGESFLDPEDGRGPHKSGILLLKNTFLFAVDAEPEQVEFYRVTNRTQTIH